MFASPSPANGQGIPLEPVQRVLEPFYTTVELSFPRRHAVHEVASQLACLAG
jgi:hypothetical protein